MTLRRSKLGPSGQVPLDVTVYGTSDGNLIKKVVGLISQGESVIVISNAEIAAAQWPGPPIKGDIIIDAGKTKTLDGSEPKYLGTEILVHICKVAG